ncbi:4Fe-4S dicluster domain-containing protein [Shewanella fodinae]|uniref:Protein NrfC n=1 Tax=Shewanella fodinae TaxID=552357 RepID=A0A4R2FDD6_9GAMM|nr:4Fe-4S dicluster domain-containing protein [Shewanella fodinae]TCN87001.1 protein NrfC [Shewanella fodinae]
MDKSKRQFLQGSGAMIAGISLYVLTNGEVAGEQQKGAVKYAMLHDENKCIGCNACADNCRKVNQVPEGVARLEIIRTGPFGEYPNQYYHFTRKSCEQCDDSPCVHVCPTGAAFKDEKTGIVSVNSWKCVGCQYCLAACPYHIRFINPVTKAADKCDFCRETQLKEGKKPACVEACPTKALVFGDLNDPNSEIVKALEENPVYRNKRDLGTHPKLFRIQAKQGGINV